MYTVDQCRCQFKDHAVATIGSTIHKLQMLGVLQSSNL